MRDILRRLPKGVFEVLNVEGNHNSANFGSINLLFVPSKRLLPKILIDLELPLIGETIFPVWCVHCPRARNLRKFHVHVITC